MSIIYTKWNYYCFGWQWKVSTTVHFFDATNLVCWSNKCMEWKILNSTAQTDSNYTCKLNTEKQSI